MVFCHLLALVPQTRRIHSLQDFLSPLKNCEFTPWGWQSHHGGGSHTMGVAATPWGWQPHHGGGSHTMGVAVTPWGWQSHHGGGSHAMGVAVTPWGWQPRHGGGTPSRHRASWGSQGRRQEAVGSGGVGSNPAGSNLCGFGSSGFWVSGFWVHCAFRSGDPDRLVSDPAGSVPSGRTGHSQLHCSRSAQLAGGHEGKRGVRI